MTIIAKVIREIIVPVPGGSAPAAPSNVLLSRQGGSSNTGTGTTTGSSSTNELSWGSVAGATGGYNVYVSINGGSFGLLGNTSSTTYTDSGATNTNGILSVIAATIYQYGVTAVGAGGESAMTLASCYLYQNGVSTQGNSDLSFSATINWADTTHTQAGSTADISIQTTNAFGGGFQPVGHPALSPMWELEIGGFSKLRFDIFITDTTNTISLLSLARPGGTTGSDVQPKAGVDIVVAGASAYGTPILNGWATLTVPLSDLIYGVTQFHGYISGTTLTVTSIDSGPGLDSCGVITGSGVTAGTIISVKPSQTGTGTYTVNNSMTVGSAGSPVALTCQRTSFYKANFNAHVNNVLWFLDNVAFIP